MGSNYDVAAYIWPSYHYEPRVSHFWPENDGEWYTVRRGSPRFPGHEMPRVPLLGYQDEADPAVMRQHVELARAHGVNIFIVDWYWYENAPCFERHLNEGLIPALAGTDSKFYLMWANHDVDSLWNMHEDTHWHPPREIVWSGQVSREVLEPMFERLAEKYFRLDCYYRIEGKPVLSIFDYPNLVAGLGGIEAITDAFNWMRRDCTTRHLGGLHLQAIARGGAEVTTGAAAANAHALGFDSATSYQYSMEGGSSGDYESWTERSVSCWPGYEAAHGVFYPHVSVGWDNTQRNPTFGSDHVVVNATPSAFEACLRQARQWLEARPAQVPLVTLNSWNEWTEGSYLLPDTRWGYDYLRAVRSVFGPK